MKVGLEIMANEKGPYVTIWLWENGELRHRSYRLNRIGPYRDEPIIDDFVASAITTTEENHAAFEYELEEKNHE